MKNWYDNLTLSLDSKAREPRTAKSGMDYFLEESDEFGYDIFSEQNVREMSKQSNQYRVASVEALKGFARIAETNTLVRLSEQDLWALKETEDGEMVIERLFDDKGEPLKV